MVTSPPRDRTNDMSERWVEWKVESSWADRNHEHMAVVLIDGRSGAPLGRANITAVGTSPSNSPSKGRSKRIHLVLSLLNGLLSQEYTIDLKEGEELSPLHFEALVDDVERVLPGLSGDVVTAIFQAINAGRMFDSLESLRNGRGRRSER